MEAATESDQQAQTTDPVVEESPAEDRSNEQVNREWRTYLHVGEGALECEHGEDGRCQEPDHFHVFCRLPNKLQINAIREKANAAKARVIRALRDPESDRHIILETDLETLKLLASKEELVSEIMATSRWRDRGEVMAELAEEEEFEHIDEDQERARVLNALPDADRDEDEYNSLIRHLDKWNEAVDTKLAEKQQPERDALMAREVDELIEMIRDERIKAEASETWMSTYSLWEWYIGTLKPRPADKGLPIERRYKSVEELKADTPERVEGIQTVFEALEQGVLSPSAKTAVRAEGN